MKKILILLLMACPVMGERVAWVQNSDDSVLKLADYDAGWELRASHKFGPGKEIRIVPYVEDPVPPHDARSQTVDSSLQVSATEVRKIFTVRALTAEEQRSADIVTRENTLASDMPALVTKLKNRTPLTEAEMNKILLFILSMQGIGE